MIVRDAPKCFRAIVTGCLTVDTFMIAPIDSTRRYLQLSVRVSPLKISDIRRKNWTSLPDTFPLFATNVRVNLFDLSIVTLRQDGISS